MCPKHGGKELGPLPKLWLQVQAAPLGCFLKGRIPTPALLWCSARLGALFLPRKAPGLPPAHEVQLSPLCSRAWRSLLGRREDGGLTAMRVATPLPGSFSSSAKTSSPCGRHRAGQWVQAFLSPYNCLLCGTRPGLHPASPQCGAAPLETLLP